MKKANVWIILWIFQFLLFHSLACRTFSGNSQINFENQSHGDPSQALTILPTEGVLTLVGTNDIHGSIAPNSDGHGGAQLFSGYVGSIRKHVERNYGARGKVLLLDAGDAIQGTLSSNYSEGIQTLKTFEKLRYDAIIAGNHGFDFGPVGWKEDRCFPQAGLCDPLGALKAAIKSTNIPWIESNVSITPELSQGCVVLV
jgi:hypothetical protein